MKESYVEGLAAHDGPESCVGVRKDVAEALTGVRTGRVFSRGSNPLPSGRPPGCRRRRRRRKATPGMSPARDVPGPRAVRDPEHVRKHLAREPGEPRSAGPDGGTGRVGKSKDERR
jgi:hypothetical protein